MASKIERLFTEVFPGEGAIYAEYGDLPPRELAIVAAAVLDAALAELLALRLVDCEREAEDFLGLNGDGRAPAGSFGSRIQLALLIGLIAPEDAAILRAVKELRNLFAHRVKIGFLSPPALKVTTKLHALWVKRNGGLIEAGAISGTSAQLKRLARQLPNHADAGEGLLFSIFCVYQAYFHRLHGRITRVPNIVAKNGSEKLGPLKS